jgi:MoaA/NifB/PqqE/SkfB family radical SAM enzyme
MSVNLPQPEADALIAVAKRRADDGERKFPPPGDRLVVPLVSIDKREDFLLDITRSQINFAKITHQNRARQVVVLMRLDIDGAPHRNPDGEVIPCPHMHIYRENFGDKWAHPLPVGKFNNLGDLFRTLEDFMTECNVVEPPRIQMGLF